MGQHDLQEEGGSATSTLRTSDLLLVLLLLLPALPRFSLLLFGTFWIADGECSVAIGFAPHEGCMSFFVEGPRAIIDVGKHLFSARTLAHAENWDTGDTMPIFAAATIKLRSHGILPASAVEIVFVPSTSPTSDSKKDARGQRATVA